MEQVENGKLRGGLTVEQENDVINGIGNAEFFNVMREEFGGLLGVVNMIGSASLYGLAFKQSTVEARAALVKLGVPERSVYAMYENFRRLRRALLAHRGIVMHEPFRAGPGKNVGVPAVVQRVQEFQPFLEDEIRRELQSA